MNKCIFLHFFVRINVKTIRKPEILSKVNTKREEKKQKNKNKTTTIPQDAIVNIL